jgi:hypothetical protein
MFKSSTCHLAIHQLLNYVNRNLSSTSHNIYNRSILGNKLLVNRSVLGNKLLAWLLANLI